MAKIDRDRIVDAALGIIAERGLDQLTLTAIATELGVTQPALYHHVPGIDHVWRAIGIRVRALLADALTDASIGRSGPDAVRSVAHTWRAFGLENPELYRSTDRFPVSGDVELEEAVQRVLRVLAAALRGFALSESQTSYVVLAMRSAFHGFVSFELGDGKPAPSDHSGAYERVVDLLITGVEGLAGTYPMQHAPAGAVVEPR